MTGEELSSIVHDAISFSLEAQGERGLASGGLLVYVWTNEAGVEQVSMVPTSGLGMHSILGLAEWIKGAIAMSLMNNTHLHGEDDLDL